jgi:hypothetical protein
MDHDGANSLAPSGWPERRRQTTGLNVGRAIIEFSDVGVRWSGGPVGIPIRRESGVRTSELHVYALRIVVKAPGVELDGVKIENINGCAGLHNDRADLEVRETVRVGSLGIG